jgi:hypothetical protein
VVADAGGWCGRAWVLIQRKRGLCDPMPLRRVEESGLELRQSDQAGMPLRRGLNQAERGVGDTGN